MLPGKFTLFLDGGGKDKDWQEGDVFQGSYAWTWKAPGGATIAQGLGPLLLPGYVPFGSCTDPLLDPQTFKWKIPFAALKITSATSEMTAFLMWGLFVLAHWQDDRVRRMIESGCCQIVFDNALGPDVVIGKRQSQAEPGLAYLLRRLGLIFADVGLVFSHHWQHSPVAYAKYALPSTRHYAQNPP